MTSLPPSRERQLLWLLALTQFTVITDFMVMMPLGPQIMQAFTITPAAFAVAVSAYSICAGLSGLFAATYIDRFDRRKLLLTVYLLFAVSNLICAAAPNYPMLLMARAFAGLTGGVMGSIVMAIVADVIPQERRGAATGTVMTAFSMAAIAGVPFGIVLGAHLGWSTPFYVLVLVSILIWGAGMRLVPSLTAHLSQTPPPLSQALPNLWALITLPRHLIAFALTFVILVSHMLVIPFISPVLVANHGVAPQQISWIYMAGGAATLFTSRLIGRLSDRFGKRDVFRFMAGLSTLPLLFLTNLPDIAFIWMVAFFPLFMICMSGRMIPLQALFTTVPEPSKRGAFLSVNSALQSLGSGVGAWLGGLFLSTGPQGRIEGYNHVGWLAFVLVVFGIIWVARVKPAEPPPPNPT